jgi:hypothetical protein
MKTPGTSAKRKREQVAKDYLEPKGNWFDPSGNLRRMSGEQDIIATVSPECSDAEWIALARLDNPSQENSPEYLVKLIGPKF